MYKKDVEDHDDKDSRLIVSEVGRAKRWWGGNKYRDNK